MKQTFAHRSPTIRATLAAAIGMSLSVLLLTGVGVQGEPTPLLPATASQVALRFDSLRSEGGTEMMSGIRAGISQARQKVTAQISRDPTSCDDQGEYLSFRSCHRAGQPRLRRRSPSASCAGGADRVAERGSHEGWCARAQGAGGEARSTVGPEATPSRDAGIFGEFIPVSPFEEVFRYGGGGYYAEGQAGRGYGGALRSGIHLADDRQSAFDDRPQLLTVDSLRDGG